MIAANFHGHCTYCDGHAAPEEFIRAAIAQGFRAYGFSSHSPLPFATTWNMSSDKMPSYILEIIRLKEKYREQIEIYAGLEIDYLDETYNASIPYFQSLPLDYRIGSIHFLPWRRPLEEDNMTCIDGSYEIFEEAVNTHYNRDIRLIVKDFFETSMRMVEIGGFDIVGHIDKIYMNGHLYQGFDIEADWFRKPFLELLDLVAEKGLIVEINSKYELRRQQTFPHYNAYKELKIRNIPVMVNSDCHYPDLVNDGRPEVLERLKDAGIKSTRELSKGKWKDFSIN